MTTTTLNNIKAILRQLVTTANATEIKVGKKIITNYDKDSPELLTFTSPFTDVTVSIVDDKVTLSGEDFKYEFALDMLMYISKKFNSITVTKPIKPTVKQQPIKQTETMKATVSEAKAVVTKAIETYYKVTIVDYSERAIAVTGDTIKLKDELKAMGGRYNKFLNCGAGWIFAKRNQQTVIDELNKLNVVIN